MEYAGDKIVSRRVLVIWTNPLFRESVRLLLQHADIEWVGAASELATARKLILRTHPDVILIEETASQVLEEVMELLEINSFVGRIVSISLQNNRLSIYHRERWTVLQAQDLLRLVLQ